MVLFLIIINIESLLPMNYKRKGEIKKLKQGIYFLPNVFTTANLFAGCFSIINAINGNYNIAAISIFIAVFLDGMVGKIARVTNAVSNFGKDYDSLSDLVSFGVAPALLFYLWGNDHIYSSALSWEKMAWLASFFYIASTALRLARFNNQLDLKYNTYFTGLPCPAAATLVSVIVWQSELMLLTPNVSFSVLMFSVVASACMMVSRVPYYSFKDIQSRRRIPFSKTVLIPLIFILILLQHPLVISVMVAFYFFSGPVYLIYGMIQKSFKANLSSSQSNRSD